MNFTHKQKGKFRFRFNEADKSYYFHLQFRFLQKQFCHLRNTLSVFNEFVTVLWKISPVRLKTVRSMPWTPLTVPMKVKFLLFFSLDTDRLKIQFFSNSVFNTSPIWFLDIKKSCKKILKFAWNHLKPNFVPNKFVCTSDVFLQGSFLQHTLLFEVDSWVVNSNCYRHRLVP